MNQFDASQPVEYLLTFPVWMVLDIRADGIEPLVTASTVDGTKAVAVFSEEVIAEQCREAWKRPQAIIEKFASNNDLAIYLDGVINYMGIHYAAIDPHADPRRGQTALIKCAEIISNKG